MGLMTKYNPRPSGRVFAGEKKMKHEKVLKDIFTWLEASKGGTLTEREKALMIQAFKAGVYSGENEVGY